jgi:hypothetical protein
MADSYRQPTLVNLVERAGETSSKRSSPHQAAHKRTNWGPIKSGAARNGYMLVRVDKGSDTRILSCAMLRYERRSNLLSVAPLRHLANKVTILPGPWIILLPQTGCGNSRPNRTRTRVPRRVGLRLASLLRMMAR